MMKKVSLFMVVILFAPLVGLAADPLATSEGYLSAIIPIALVIGIILFFAFLGSNY